MTRGIPVKVGRLGFHHGRQVPVALLEVEAPTSIADFAVPEKRLAIYIDGAAFHVGERLRRDRWIREKLRNEKPPWTVVELRVGDLKDVKIVQTLIHQQVQSDQRSSPQQ